MSDIRLIAFDLDDTLLNSEKQLTPATADALRHAADAGILLVPATGRIYPGIPKSLMDLGIVRYAITVNGAYVVDLQTKQVIYRAELPYAQAAKILGYWDGHPLVYDSYIDNRGYMSRDMYEHIADYSLNDKYYHMVHDNRQQVDELKAFILEKKRDVQKIQCYLWDMDLKKRFMREIPEIFENVTATTAIKTNLEVIQSKASKGIALEKLAAHLGFGIDQTAAFGDGNNDLSMIRAAGRGFAMRNAAPEILEIADVITKSCDEDGVAFGIEHYIL